MITQAKIQGPDVDRVLRESLEQWGIKYLTDIQRRAVEAGAASGKSLFVCAPTSSGKTLVGEIAVHQALRRGHRCLYLVSHKALADQKFLDFIDKFGGEDSNPFGSVGLSTGDREEGDIKSDILVATYEKGLALFLSGQIDPRDSLVVADELQIIGDPSRGAQIEVLCAFLRQRTVKQFLALTATVENPNDLASWIGCRVVESPTRDVDLRQEIWYQGKCYVVKFGQDSGEIDSEDTYFPNDALDVVTFLLDQGRAPILVFTESRREAARYANDFAQRRQKHASGIGISEQLELFSEPTERSESLQSSAERRIAFHTADLLPQERQVIEKGFLKNGFDVCFATSTLAAGVNFPFRTVVFPKLTYQYGDRSGNRISRADYRNMSGRAGRLGMHDMGFAVLLPKNAPENSQANALVLPENDRVDSQLIQLTMRRSVLTLVATGGVHTKHSLQDFFKNTYFSFLLQDRNPEKLKDVLAMADRALDWLEESEFIEQEEANYIATQLGQATAISGLLPTTAKDFSALLSERSTDFDQRFQEQIGGLIHWACCCDEFRGNSPSRFLPYPIGGVSDGSAAFVANHELLCQLDRSDFQLCQSVHALLLFIEGLPERLIFRRTNISSGNVHRLASDIAWIFDGLCTIASVPDLACPQTIGNSLAMLARRVRWGAPADSIDLIRVAQRARVPGFGRQRAMDLSQHGATTFEDIEDLGIKRLAAILKSHQRAEALLDAIDEAIDITPNRYSSVHKKVAEQLGIGDLVADCAKLMEKKYEDAIVRLLKVETSWNVHVRDDGKKRNEPDILIRHNNESILLEVKTAPKRRGLIKKEAAFAVLQKGSDYETNIARVTLGKPTFQEMAKVKAAASKAITLVEHVPFLEGFLRVLAEEITPEEFLKWLKEPGEAELQRLPGKSTNLLV